MSIRVTITDPGGYAYQVEVPISAVAATDSKTPYAETQQMLSDFTARTVSAVLNRHHDSVDFPSHPRFEWSNQRQLELSSGPDDPYIDQRTLDSCYVQRVGQYVEVGEDEVRVVVKKPGRHRGSPYQYRLKKHAPLRRVLNAYTAEIGRDVAHFELCYKGTWVRYDDTAEDLGIISGETIRVHDHRHDSMSPIDKDGAVKEEVS